MTKGIITTKEVSRLLALRDEIDNEEMSELITKAVQTINAAIIVINDSKSDKDLIIEDYKNKLKDKQKELDRLESKVRLEIEKNIDLYTENMKLKGLEE